MSRSPSRLREPSEDRRARRDELQEVAAAFRAVAIEVVVPVGSSDRAVEAKADDDDGLPMAMGQPMRSRSPRAQRQYLLGIPHQGTSLVDPRAAGRGQLTEDPLVEGLGGAVLDRRIPPAPASAISGCAQRLG